MRESYNVQQRQIAPPALNLADIVAVQIGQLRQFFLGKIPFQS